MEQKIKRSPYRGKVNSDVLIMVFLLCIVLISCGNKTATKVGDQKVEHDDEKSVQTENMETPYNILSIDDAINIYTFYPIDKMQSLLLRHEYQFETEYQTEENAYYYWTKDCKIGRTTNGYDIISNTKSSSYVEICEGNRSVYVYAFDEAVFKAWYSQIVALGYKIDSESNKGNQGQDWIAEKEGEPDISIWNDYGDKYILYIGVIEKL